MLQQFICSGTMYVRELKNGAYGEDWFRTEEPFWHLVTADTEDEAKEKVRKHYKNKDQEYYLKHEVLDIRVWENIQ